jgi:flagellar M-ring protein FliF
MDVGEPVTTGVGQILKDNLMSILRAVFALAVIAAILKFGVMPMMARLAPVEGLEAGKDLAALPGGSAEGGEEEDEDAPDSLPAAASATRARRNQPAVAANGVVTGQILDDDAKAGPDDMVTIGAVRGGVHRGWINTVSGLIETQPTDSLKVVKTWLAEGM